MSNAMDVQKNYAALSVAVVERAILDYELGRGLMGRTKNQKSTKYFEGQRLVNEATEFFKSKRFSLFADCNGEALLKKIEKNYDTYGKCMPNKVF